MLNNIGDLNNILFDAIGRLDDIDDKKDLKLELEKTKSKVDISKMIIEVAHIQLDAMKLQAEYNLAAKEMPELIAQKQLPKIEKQDWHV